MSNLRRIVIRQIVGKAPGLKLQQMGGGEKEKRVNTLLKDTGKTPGKRGNPRPRIQQAITFGAKRRQKIINSLGEMDRINPKRLG